ncbi:hypothetical protein J6P92_03460 [bacterium]|nr:hypothetical protein [bacterium]
MDERNFTVIENKTQTEEKPVTKSVVTNPIAKKFVKFINEKEKFSVKELFFK